MLPRKHYVASDLADIFGGFGRLMNFDEDWVVAPKLEIDIEDRSECYEIKANLPDVKKEDIHINVEGRTLTIAVAQSQSNEDKNKKYLVRERRSGSSSRSIVLPTEFSQDSVSASLRDGVLYVSVKKEEARQNKRIEIN
jgi:HSP20 family protein